MKFLISLIFCFILSGCTTIDYAQIRKNYISTHSHLSADILEAISERKIKSGMTKEQVQISWEKDPIFFEYPMSKTCDASGCIETYQCGHKYFTFLNDKLINFSEINY